MAMDMTHPGILHMEKWGHDFYRLNEPPTLFCEHCGEGIYENEDYYDIGICEGCADLHTWTYYPEPDEEPPACENCGERMDALRPYVSLPNGDGDFCRECFEETKMIAVAA